MNNDFDDKTFIEGLKYAFNIITETKCFIDFSNAMIDFFGVDFPYIKSIYSALNNWPGVYFKVEDSSIWSNYSNEYILDCYNDYKFKLEARDREKNSRTILMNYSFLLLNIGKVTNLRRCLLL